MNLIYIIGVISSCAIGQKHDDVPSHVWNDDEDAFLQMSKMEYEIGADSEGSYVSEVRQGTMNRLVERASSTEAVQEAMASLGLSAYSVAVVDLRAMKEATPAPTPAAPTGNTGWNTVKANISNNWDADATGAMFDAAGQVFNSLGSILGKAISGQGVTKGDWIALGETACQAALSAGVAILQVGLSAMSGGVLGLIGSLVGGLISSLFALTEEPVPTTGDLINRALAKERLDENKDFWLGLSEEMGALGALFTDTANSDNTDAKTSWYLIMQHDLSVNRAKVFGDCLDPETWSSDTCKQYIEDGMIEVMVPYAEAHMSMLWELLMLFMENPAVDISVRRNQVDILHVRLQELGAQYHAALKNAWEIYYPWRMGLIWNPYMQNVTTSYSWWDDSWTYDAPDDSNDIYHPFDFLHAMKDNGYNELDTEFPINHSKGSWSNDWNNIRNWAYDGCWGERHDDVTSEKKPQNDACNLYRHIVGSENDGCNCGPGEYADAKWLDRRPNHTCWAECMDTYIAEVDAHVNKEFGGAIDKLLGFVQNLSFPQKWKAVLGENGTHCDDASLINISYCQDAFDYINASYGDLTSVSDSTVPAGCSLRVSDNNLIINSAESGEKHADYKPLCGANFFATLPADTLGLNGQLVGTDALTSADGLAKAQMQSDGNFVIYHGGTAHWSTKTSTAGSYISFEFPGKLVLYSPDGTSLWSEEHNGAAKLVIQNNCSLDILGIHGEALWSSGSSCVDEGE